MGEADYDHIVYSREKTSEAKDLNAEVLAYTIRTSNLQTRLLQTLDALDDARHKHTTEVMDLERKYAHLRSRFEKQRNTFVASEMEKDDLKDSVLQLVEKVERSNDVHSWPFSRLQLSDFADDPRQFATNSAPLSEEDQLAYAGSIIDRLRRERDDERVAHVLTREGLQSKIDMLETQLARREAELEFCATHAACITVLSGRNNPNIGSDFLFNDGMKAKRPGSSYTKPRPTAPMDDAAESLPEQVLTNAEIVKMLNMTAARNRVLEVEIKTLFKRLQQARSAPGSSSVLPTTVTSPQSSLMAHQAAPPPQPSDSPSSIANDRMIGRRFNKTGDGYDPEDKDFDDDDDGHRTSHAQQWLSGKSTRNKGPSRLRVHEMETPPVDEPPQEDKSHFSWHGHQPKRPKGSSAKILYAVGDQVNLTQDPPIRLGLFSVPDAHDDGHSARYVHSDDGVSVALSPVVTYPGSVPSAQSNVSCDPDEHGKTRAIGAANDTSNLNFRTTSSRISRSKSATISGLDQQIDELSSQIDAFRREREKLTTFVALQRQHFQLAPREEDEASATLSVPPTSGVGQPVTGYWKFDNTTAPEREDNAVEHGDDQVGIKPTKDANTEAFDALKRRLNAVEYDCLQLRQELTECRTVYQLRENELIDKIRASQRRVDELNLVCHPTSRPPSTAFISDEHDVESFLDQDPSDGRQDHSHRQHLQHFVYQTDSLSVLENTPGPTSNNPSENGLLHTYRLRPHDQTSDEDNLGLAGSPPLVSGPPIDTTEPLLISPTQPPILSNSQHPWSNLYNTDFDNLLGAIDGEVSMELDTPLMPTTASLRSLSPSDAVPQSGSERGNSDDVQSSSSDGSREMILDDIPRSDAHVQREMGPGLEHENLDHEFRLGDDDGDDDDGIYQTVGVGGVHNMINRGEAGLLGDETLYDDVESSSGRGDDDFPNSSPPTLLLEEEETRGQIDEDSANGYEEHQLKDRPLEGSLFVSHQHQHHDVGDREYTMPEGSSWEGDVTVMVAAHSHSREYQSNNSGSNSTSPPRSPPSSLSPTISSDEKPHTESILARAESELRAAQELLDQGENTLRSVEARLSLDSSSPPSRGSSPLKRETPSVNKHE